MHGARSGLHAQQSVTFCGELEGIAPKVKLLASRLPDALPDSPDDLAAGRTRTGTDVAAGQTVEYRDGEKDALLLDSGARVRPPCMSAAKHVSESSVLHV